MKKEEEEEEEEEEATKSCLCRHELTLFSRSPSYSPGSSEPSLI
jgi:hypothetical protein